MNGRGAFRGTASCSCVCGQLRLQRRRLAHWFLVTGVDGLASGWWLPTVDPPEWIDDVKARPLDLVSLAYPHQGLVLYNSLGPELRSSSTKDSNCDVYVALSARRPVPRTPHSALRIRTNEGALRLAWLLSSVCNSLAVESCPGFPYVYVSPQRMSLGHPPQAKTSCTAKYSTSSFCLFFLASNVMKQRGQETQLVSQCSKRG